LREVRKRLASVKGHLTKQFKMKFRPSCVTDLCVSVNAVRTPTTRLYLVRIQAPEFQLFFKQWSAYICRIVQFSRPETVHLTVNPRPTRRDTSLESGGIGESALNEP
jgi:hypothetical protein